MKKGVDPPLVTAGGLLERALTARKRGYHAAAWRHLEAAEACDPERRNVDLGLFRGQLLQDKGQDDEAVLCLEAIAKAHPGNIRPFYRLALIKRRQGDPAAAWQHLEAALKCDPERRNGAVRSLRIDLLIDRGCHSEAEDLLHAVLDTSPGALWACRRLAKIAEQKGDVAAATRHLEAALTTAGDAPDLLLELARFKAMGGDFAGAADVLETLRDQHGPSPRVLLRLLHACRELGDRPRERDCLDQLITADPLQPDLLRLIFTTYGAQATPEMRRAVLQDLRGKISPDLFDALTIQVLSAVGDHAGALQHLQRPPKAQRSEDEAVRVANALFGMHRYFLGQRYLQACMRRWPENRQMLSLYVNTALKLGRYGDVETWLHQADPYQPERCLVPLWFQLFAYQGQFDRAVTCYQRMQDLGLIRLMHRHRLITMMFCLPDPEDVPALFDKIGRPNPANADGRSQSTLPGQQMTEFELEQRAVAESGGFASPKDWVEARPGSTVAAVRLVNAWYGEDPKEPGPEAAEIPRQIFQYWDQVELPQSLLSLVATWENIPDVPYERLNRASALKFLGAECGPLWVRAFRLARNAAQEADFLRLCLLAKRGGVYADADDMRVGDLDQLLGQGRGLILYREALGGILANNFIAAAPGHPAIVYAARLARAALLQRSNETIWSSTGPGLMTRAVGQYLAKLPQGHAPALKLYDWSEIASGIFMHNKIAYKSSPKHWNWTGRSQDGVWGSLQAALTDLDKKG